MSNPTHVITVDAAGTLIRPWPSVGAVYGGTARKFGLTVEDGEVDRRFYEVFGKVQKDRKITSGKEKDFWKQVVLAVFEPHAEKRNLDPLFEELWELFARGDHWRLADGAKNTLSELQERGYRLAVLSNNDSRLRSVLKDLAIDSLFEKIFISSEMGIEKPDPAIFREVEKSFGKEPSRFLHVGDSHSRDFEGARKAGWDALLFGKPIIEERQITTFPELLALLP
jgi:putative hydrolase of the HAD superfamily